jgi:hypothetical protein
MVAVSGTPTSVDEQRVRDPGLEHARTSPPGVDWPVDVGG